MLYEFRNDGIVYAATHDPETVQFWFLTYPNGQIVPVTEPETPAVVEGAQTL